MIPSCLSGLNVLDLGSGSGRDVFSLSQFVGENGHVVGIDMTEEQLQVCIMCPCIAPLPSAFPCKARAGAHDGQFEA